MKLNLTKNITQKNINFTKLVKGGNNENSRHYKR